MPSGALDLQHTLKPLGMDRTSRGPAPHASSGSAAGEVTRLLSRYGDGDREALDELIPLLYSDLKRVARGRLSREGPGRPFDTTGLVHEAYMRLVDFGSMTIESRAHFLSIAARAMRRILIEEARRSRAAKRGGGAVPVTLDPAVHGVSPRSERLLELDEAIRALAGLDERQAAVVELRVFGGMTVDECATALDLSPATVKRAWAAARAWLNRELSR